LSLEPYGDIADPAASGPDDEVAEDAGEPNF
jgi:hypothetical protein